MSDGWRKNSEKVAEGWANWRQAMKVRWWRLGEAVDEKDVKDVFHNLAGFIGDTIQELHRTWLYISISLIFVYLGATFLPYNWPLSWTGF